MQTSRKMFRGIVAVRWRSHRIPLTCNAPRARNVIAQGNALGKVIQPGAKR
jgi:hypothetical protein